MTIYPQIKYHYERGKKICKTLKEVRKQVAKANDIVYSPTECHHEGALPVPARNARLRCVILSNNCSVNASLAHTHFLT